MYVSLREVRDDDLPVFYSNDAEEIRTAAFTAKDPSDRALVGVDGKPGQGGCARGGVWVRTACGAAPSTVGSGVTWAWR